MSLWRVVSNSAQHIVGHEDVVILMEFVAIGISGTGVRLAAERGFYLDGGSVSSVARGLRRATVEIGDCYVRPGLSLESGVGSKSV
jgi:hypothetical protein